MSSNVKEYQHFIPQFLLRNFAYPFQCCGLGRKKCKCKNEKGKHPGDLIVNLADLTSAPYHIRTAPVKRIFGADSMYNDPAKAHTNEHRRIERMLGQMESRASTIFRQITKSYESGDKVFLLSRPDRDLVRKFLFLLKYRGSGFHRRFYHGTPEEYDSNDRERLLKYMKDHRIATPLDVWFQNLEAIINIKMDPQHEWTWELPKRMFPDDANWFIMHCQHYYMALCTPEDMSSEFVLTDNSYNIFEGPNTFVTDRATGQVLGGGHAGFHEFSPISPSIMIVLRSYAVANPIEDSDPRVKERRDDDRWSAFEEPFGTDWTSLLKDLPIKKAHSSCCQTINGRVVPAEGFDGKYRPTDRFYFTFHLISANHVQTINNISLDNSYSNTVLVFRTRTTFLSTLESYVTGPCDSHKIICGEHAGKQYQHYRQLESLVQMFGFQGSLVWRRIDNLPTVSSERFIEKQNEFRHIMDPFMQGHEDTKDNPATCFFRLYTKFDSPASFPNNVAQAGRMIRFEQFVDFHSRLFSESVRNSSKSIISDLFQSLCSARYWIYLKLRRKSCLGDRDGTQDIVDIFADKMIREGPEDAFANAATFLKRETLNQLMSLATLNDVDLRTLGMASLWNRSNTLFEDLIRYVIIFDRPGSIRNCGIPQIECLAQEVTPRSNTCAIPQVHFSISSNETCELLTRIRVRPKFRDRLSGILDEKILAELADVFFRLTFPTPPWEA